MEMIMNVFEWLHTFLISSGIAEGIDNFIREFFRDMGEIIVLSTFFIILFIRIFKFLLIMMVVFALIKFGILIL